MHPSAPPPIPYVEHHEGERRLLTLTLGHPGGPRNSAVVVGIDGRSYVVTWPVAVFEIPADRPVHVSVHLTGTEYPCPAAVLLFPPSVPQLTYRMASGSGAATLV